jgi:hypothetical protein
MYDTLLRADIYLFVNGHGVSVSKSDAHHGAAVLYY